MKTMTTNPSFIPELRLQTAKVLKETLPLYPVVRREVRGKEIVFSTLVRKKYNGKYYLIPMEYKGEDEAKNIHGLHANVYKYLMLGKLDFLDTEDSEQENECTRLLTNK